ncbi:MAG: cell division protein FtsQ/DivIB [Wenzhouxiangellaceae bacterium]|nr:cell division protein FtsQ/DivIB [Wenzhouxiangellaceae bacterium]
MKTLGWWVATPVALLLIGGLAAWSAGWHDAQRWPIRWLEVEGQIERTTAAQVRAAVAESARRGFFAVDVDDARSAVEALPWIAEASVARHWPDALHIVVVEHRAAARWNRTTLVSRGGEPFDVAGTDGMQGLPRLTGPEGRREEVFEAFRRFAPRLASAGLELAALDRDPRGSWTLELVDGRRLLLGREQVVERLERFLAVRRDLARMQGVRFVDLRYPNGLAVTTAEREPSRMTDNEEHIGVNGNHG